MNPMKVGLLGLGVVGGGTWSVLSRNAEEIARRAGRRIEVTRAAVRDVAKARTRVGDALLVDTDVHALVRDPEIDIVVELIGGDTLARELVLEAIANGKHVVTANKALVAAHADELAEAADRAGRRRTAGGAAASAARAAGGAARSGRGLVAVELLERAIRKPDPDHRAADDPGDRDRRDRPVGRLGDGARRLRARMALPDGRADAAGATVQQDELSRRQTRRHHEVRPHRARHFGKACGVTQGNAIRQWQHLRGGYRDIFGVTAACEQCAYRLPN